MLANLRQLQDGELRLSDGDSVHHFGATGTEPLLYQWRKNGTNLANGARINGATNATLTLNNVSATAAGAYSVTATNAAGSTASTRLGTGVSLPVCRAMTWSMDSPPSGISVSLNCAPLR